MLDQDALDEINNNMRPIIQPTDTWNTILSVEGLPTIGAGATGLNTGIIMHPYPIEIVEDELKKLNYGKYIKEFYDCEDRAFWGVMHLRHKFPGVPVGVVSGQAVEGPVSEMADRSHAVILLWYRERGELKYVFWDPLPEHQGEIKFDPSIFITFPIGKPEIPMVNPVPTDYYRINNNTVVFDQRRMVYELRTEDKKGLLDYLERGDHDTACKESHEIFNQPDFPENWRDYDKASWPFVHVRRAYPGCPVGVAIGNPVTGKSYSSVILWDKDSKLHYWDPITKKEESKFKPRIAFV
ncbi:Uncharacterised protein [uncultured archaeon]|nr:Uncharacterised protein [uncultured archaeon]